MHHFCYHRRPLSVSDNKNKWLCFCPSKAVIPSQSGKQSCYSLCTCLLFQQTSWRHSLWEESAFLSLAVRYEMIIHKKASGKQGIANKLSPNIRHYILLCNCTQNKLMRYLPYCQLFFQVSLYLAYLKVSQATENEQK